MFNISSVNNNSINQFPSPINEDAQIEKIREAKNRGLFQLHEEELTKPIDTFYRKESYLDFINQLIEDSKATPSKVKEYKQLICFLFTTTIDPEIDLDEKKSVIEETLGALNADQIKNFIFGLYERKLPSLITTNILLYSSNEIWNNLYKRILKYDYDSDFCKTHFVPWIEQTIDNHQWSPVEKHTFLDKLFDVLPPKTGDNLIYSFILNSEEDRQKQFLQVSSLKLAKRMTDLQDQIVQFGQSTISGLESKIEVVKVDFRDSQRAYFLEWFFNHALHHQHASLIAAGFDKKDWEWLSIRMDKKENRKENNFRFSWDPPSPRVFIAMQWIISIANHLKSGNISVKDVRFFFSYAFALIEKEKGWESISSEDREIFFLALTEETLFNYFDAFAAAARNEVIKHVVHKEPKKLISWLERSLRVQDDHYDNRASAKINVIFYWISSNHFFQKAINIVFDTTSNDDVFRLSIYSALDKDAQREILKHLMINRDEGIKTLLRWVEISLCKTEYLPLYVKDSFTTSIHSQLQQIDPKLVSELKEALNQSYFIQTSQEHQKFVDFMLPINLDSYDFAVLQERAIEALKNHFQSIPEVPHRDSKIFISGLRKALEGGKKEGKNNTDWIQKLFERLPEETWPLVFLYFEMDIRDFFFTSPETEDVLFEPFEDRWVDFVAKTLTQITYNHYLGKTKAVWALEALGLDEKPEAVFQKFVEIVPHELFVPTIAFLCYSNHFDEDKIYKLVALSIENANVDKKFFIASCIAGKWHRDESFAVDEWVTFVKNSPYVSQFEKKLWKEPFLNNHHERTEVAKGLIKVTGSMESFLQLFNSPIILESLKATGEIQDIKEEETDTKPT